MEHITEKIKSLRKHKGYSHEYLAHELDISQVTYSKLEKMKPNLP